MTFLLNASVRPTYGIVAAACSLLSCQGRDAEARIAPTDSDTIGAGPEQDRPRTRGRIPYGFNGVPYLGQWMAPWGRLRYGDDARCSTFTEGGCGPTAFAMVLQHFGHNANPDDVGALAVSTGARRCSGGTDGLYPPFLEALAAAYDVDATFIPQDYRRVLGILRQRQPVIAIGHCRGYTARARFKSYAAHFLVLTGVDVIKHRGQRRTVVRVNDPGNPSGVGIAYMTTSQLRRMRRFLSVTPAVGRPTINVAMVPTTTAPTRCDRSVLRSLQRFADAGTLRDEEWVAYGRTLTACGPGDRPWEALGAGDREGFLDEYIIPFVNGDAVRGSPFQNREPRRYEDLVRQWRLEG